MDTCDAYSLIDTEKLNSDQLIKFGCYFDRACVWLKIINTHKLSNDQLLDIGNRVANANVWLEIIEEGDFSNEELIELGKNLGDKFSAWYFISKKLKIDEFNDEELLGFASKIDKEDFWNVVIATGKLSNEQLLDVYKKNKNKKHDLGVKISDVLKLDNLTKEELLSLGNKFNNQYVWDSIIRKVKLSSGELWKLGGKLKNADNWNTIIEIGKFTNEQLIEICCSYPCANIWRTVFELQQLSLDQFLSICTNCKQSVDMYFIPSSTFFKNANADDLLKIGYGLDVFGLWLSIIKTNKLNNEQLLKIGEHDNSPKIWHEISQRLNYSDHSNKELLELCHSNGNHFVWEAIARYLNFIGLEVGDILEFAKKTREFFIFKKIVDTKKLNNDQLLELGFKLDDSRLWKHITQNLS